MKNNITEYILLLILAGIWSISFLLIKVGVETITPFTLTAIRLIIAAIIFCAFLAFKGEWIPMHPRALLLYVGSGLLGNSLPFVLISWGETHVSSSLAAILMGVMPISTFVLAHFFISDEPMTVRKSVGVAFGFFGLITLVGLSAISGFGGHLLGQITILCGALSYSFSTIFVRSQPSFSGYKMAAGMNICAAMVSLTLAFLFEDPLLLQPSMDSVHAVVLLAIFPTAVASLIYFRVLRILGATVFAQINYLIPVLGGIWGVLILGEVLKWNVFPALFFVLGGIYFIQSKSGG